jgi:hypothetical protein
MNIFPKDLQYFITELFFENKQEIIPLYMDLNYSNKDLRGYYPPDKIKKENINIGYYMRQPMRKRPEYFL